jgi:hypothetical protein
MDEAIGSQSLNRHPQAGQVRMASPQAIFTEGAPVRPPIRLDHGFLDDGKGNLDLTKREPPTSADLELKRNARTVCALAAKLKPELIDGVLAFKHFLDGTGTEMKCDYEKFLSDDSNGQIVLASAIEDARAGVLDLFDLKNAKPAGAERTDTMSLTSGAVGVGRNFRYPGPSTEDWQKTIGDHSLWLSADATVQSKPLARRREVKIVLTLHAEDMYNFDPGKADIATGMPDSMNGRLEVVGLAHEFLTTGTAVRTITFSVPLERLPDNHVMPKDQVVR